MANQKVAKELRTEYLGTVAETEFEGGEFVGFTSEGAVFKNGSDVVVVRVIVKAETFDYATEVAEYEEKIRKQEQEKLNRKK